MPLSDDEKRHIEAVEEYRHEVRRRLEESHAPCPRGAKWAGTAWKFFNSSLFITVVVGSGLGLWLKELDRRRSKESATLETRLKLLEQDRGFLIDMIGKVNQDTPKKERVSRALKAYKQSMLSEYRAQLNTEISFPGIETILDLSAEDVERSGTLADTQAVAAPVKAAIVRLEGARTGEESRSAIKPLENLLRNEKSAANLPMEQRQQLQQVVRQVNEDPSPTIDEARARRLGDQIAQIALPETRREESAALGILTAAGRGSVSLFVHVAGEEQAMLAERWLAKLRRLHPDAFASAKVLRYDQINLAPREKPTDVRYEAEEDKALAESIRNELSAAMRGQPLEPLEPIAPRFRSGSGRQIEVWLNRDVALRP
jgi:hypothetical protein